MENENTFSKRFITQPTPNTSHKNNEFYLFYFKQKNKLSVFPATRRSSLTALCVNRQSDNIFVSAGSNYWTIIIIFNGLTA